VFIEAKDDGGGGDNWSHNSSKAPVKISPPTNQHIHTAFTGRTPILSPNQQCQSTECMIPHSMDLFIPNSPGGLPTLYKKLSWCWQTRTTHLEVSQGHQT